MDMRPDNLYLAPRHVVLPLEGIGEDDEDPEVELQVLLVHLGEVHPSAAATAAAWEDRLRAELNILNIRLDYLGGADKGGHHPHRAGAGHP
jgi:hypothetical protein